MTLKKVVVFLICYISAISCCACGSQHLTKENVGEYFSDQLNFKLPETADIIEYYSDYNYGSYSFNAKILIKEKDIKCVISGLDNFFEIEAIEDTGDYNYYGPVYSEDTISSLKRVEKSFDFEYDDIQKSYNNRISVPISNEMQPRMIENWIFLCKNEGDNGDYYLYISKMP